jgi:hypothetical protein
MTYTISLTDQEVQVLGAALAELPFKVSSALISNIQNQINEQIQNSESEQPSDKDPLEE